VISQELEVSLHMAFVEARSARHEFITVEHLLLSLLDNAAAIEVLKACSADMDELRNQLRKFVTDNTPVIPAGSDVDTQPTLGFQRVIQRAIMHVSAGGASKKPVTGANVLVAIFGEKESHAVFYLQQQGISRLDVVNFLSHGISKQGAESAPASDKEPQANGEESAEARQTPLDLYAQDLNADAIAGRIDPLIGR
jgi:ATP-dependent Clp protease ATP-binding subunit ClpA